MMATEAARTTPSAVPCDGVGDVGCGDAPSSPEMAAKQAGHRPSAASLLQRQQQQFQDEVKHQAPGSPTSLLDFARTEGRRLRAGSCSEEGTSALPLSVQPCVSSVEQDARVKCDARLPANGDIKQALAYQGVQVERIVGNWPNIFIFVRVLELGAPKRRVFVRRTFNNWQSYLDLEADFVKCDGPSARYLATVRVPTAEDVHHVVEFAVGYQSNGMEYWDNNKGANYRVEVAPSSQESPEAIPRRLSK